MRVSLIVATEPDAFHLKERNFFASFGEQKHPHDALELIVVDSHARPSTAAAFAAFRSQYPLLSASLLPCASTARAVANNLAAAHATGELLIFLADDFDPCPDLVAAHATYHRLNPDIDAVGIGPGFFPDDIRRDIFARWQEDSGQLFGVPMRRTAVVWPRTYFYAGNASIKKAKFDALGGFDERFRYDAWDDYEFGLRWMESGGYSQFIAGAVAAHRHAVSFEERCAVLERAGRSARVLEQLHPNRNHHWPALQRGARARRPIPDKDATTHVRIAFYSERLDEAFRRGYLAHDDCLA
ncbi:MAG: glycosyltransferase [Casimicrobiaceae bacterium]